MHAQPIPDQQGMRRSLSIALPQPIIEHSKTASQPSHSVMKKRAGRRPWAPPLGGDEKLGLRRWGEALECFERAVGAGGTAPGAWRGKAVALDALGRDAEAAGAWERAGGRPSDGQAPVFERGLRPGDATFFLREIGQSVAGQAAVRAGESTVSAAVR